MLILFKIDYRDCLLADRSYMVFQAVHDFPHFGEIGKALKLAQYFHCFRHNF